MKSEEAQKQEEDDSNNDKSSNESANSNPINYGNRGIFSVIIIKMVLNN